MTFFVYILIGFLFGFHWSQNHFCQRTPNGPCTKEDINQAISRLDGGNVLCVLEQTKGEETVRHEKGGVGFTHDPEDTTHNRIFTHLLNHWTEKKKKIIVKNCKKNPSNRREICIA